jgi:ABC-type sugar transport system substrate-binding protein
MHPRLALFSMDGGEYQELLRDDCQQAANRHRLNLRVFQADGDSQKQVRQIQSCLAEPPEQRPTAIIVCPVREVSLLSVAHATARRGIAWVFLLRWSDYSKS